MQNVNMQLAVVDSIKLYLTLSAKNKLLSSMASKQEADAARKTAMNNLKLKRKQEIEKRAAEATEDVVTVADLDNDADKTVTPPPKKSKLVHFQQKVTSGKNKRPQPPKSKEIVDSSSEDEGDADEAESQIPGDGFMNYQNTIKSICENIMRERHSHFL